MVRKIIGLLGSPLPEGNTAQLLARAMKGAEDAGCAVELIPVTHLDFQSCQEMFFCRDHETCILDDDMQQIFPKFADMDSLILAGDDDGNSRHPQIVHGPVPGFFYGQVPPETASGFAG